MPELPEVEAARRLIERSCVGKRIEKAVVANDVKVFEGAALDEFRAALEGRRVDGVHRKGKYLWLQLDTARGPWPLLHFGMTGGIVVQKMGFSKYKRVHLESDPEEWPPRFCKLDLELEGGGRLAFVDSRRFARVKLQVDPPACDPLCRLGFDVFTDMPPLDDFSELLRRRVARAPALKIKALLLDQEFCSGIGNWVGDEVLYQSRIHPEQTAASLDAPALAALHEAIREVVGLAVAVEADSEQFPRDWLFHYRWTNKKASSIGGKTIQFVTVGSRTSAFVPAVQKLKGGGGGAAAGRKNKAGAAAGTGRKRRAKAAGSDDEEAEEEEAASSSGDAARDGAAAAGTSSAEDAGAGEEDPAVDPPRGRSRGKQPAAKKAVTSRKPGGEKAAAGKAKAKEQQAPRRVAAGKGRKRKADEEEEEEEGEVVGEEEEALQEEEVVEVGRKPSARGKRVSAKPQVVKEEQDEEEGEEAGSGAKKARGKGKGAARSGGKFTTAAAAAAPAKKRRTPAAQKAEADQYGEQEEQEEEAEGEEEGGDGRVSAGVARRSARVAAKATVTEAKPAPKVAAGGGGTKKKK